MGGFQKVKTIHNLRIMGKYEDRYNNKANTVQLWKDKASDLGKSAIALQNIGIEGGILPSNRTSIMLMGMSLEALIKGYLVANEVVKIDSGKFPSVIKKHQLIDLYELAGIVLTKEYEEKTFVKRLSEQVVWMGRYPVPTNSNTLQNMKNRTLKAWIMNEKDREFFAQLYEALYNKY